MSITPNKYDNIYLDKGAGLGVGAADVTANQKKSKKNIDNSPFNFSEMLMGKFSKKDKGVVNKAHDQLLHNINKLNAVEPARPPEELINASETQTTFTDNTRESHGAFKDDNYNNRKENHEYDDKQPSSDDAQHKGYEAKEVTTQQSTAQQSQNNVAPIIEQTVIHKSLNTVQQKPNKLVAPTENVNVNIKENTNNKILDKNTVANLENSPIQEKVSKNANTFTTLKQVSGLQENLDTPQVKAINPAEKPINKVAAQVKASQAFDTQKSTSQNTINVTNQVNQSKKQSADVSVKINAGQDDAIKDVKVTLSDGADLHKSVASEQVKAIKKIEKALPEGEKAVLFALDKTNKKQDNKLNASDVTVKSKVENETSARLENINMQLREMLRQSDAPVTMAKLGAENQQEKAMDLTLALNPAVQKLTKKPVNGIAHRKANNSKQANINANISAGTNKEQSASASKSANNEAWRQSISQFSNRPMQLSQSLMASASADLDAIPTADGSLNGQSANNKLQSALAAKQAQQTPQAPVTKQVMVGMRTLAQNKGGEATIRLQPAELGNIIIQMEVAKDGLVSASIHAERTDTLELLRQDSRNLISALQDTGLNVESNSLSFFLQSQSQWQEHAKQFAAASAQELHNSKEENNEIDMRLEISEVESHSHSGHMNIRV